MAAGSCGDSCNPMSLMICGKYTSSDLSSSRRAGGGLGGPQGGRGFEIFEILEQLGGIEDLEIAVDQHRHLPLRIDPEHLRMLRLIEPLHVEGDHDELEVQAL